MEILTPNYINNKNMVNYPITYYIIIIKYSLAMIELALEYNKMISVLKYYDKSDSPPSHVVM